jgi:hypothetical protein
MKFIAFKLTFGLIETEYSSKKINIYIFNKFRWYSHINNHEQMRMKKGIERGISNAVVLTFCQLSLCPEDPNIFQCTGP